LLRHDAGKALLRALERGIGIERRAEIVQRQRLLAERLIGLSAPGQADGIAGFPGQGLGEIVDRLLVVAQVRYRLPRSRWQ